MRKDDKGLPESDASMDGATEGSKQGASDAAIRRGFTKLGDDRGVLELSTAPGTSGGFLGRASGWER